MLGSAFNPFPKNFSKTAEALGSVLLKRAVEYEHSLTALVHLTMPSQHHGERMGEAILPLTQ